MFQQGRSRRFHVAFWLPVCAFLFFAPPVSGETTFTLTGIQQPVSGPEFSFTSDLARWPKRLWGSARNLPSWENFQVLSLGGGWAYVASADWDRDVRHETFENYRRMGSLNDAFSLAGHPLLHFGTATILYTSSLFSQNEKLHDFSMDLIDSFILTDVSNQSLKYAFDSDRPNGDRFGFPSGHTASSFAFASVVESHFGLFPGLVAYGLAGMVGWHRIDDRKHELSDVLAGAAIGYVVGRSVTGNNLFASGDVRIVPYSDPYGGGTGVGIAWKF